MLFALFVLFVIMGALSYFDFESVFGVKKYNINDIVNVTQKGGFVEVEYGTGRKDTFLCFSVSGVRKCIDMETMEIGSIDEN